MPRDEVFRWIAQTLVTLGIGFGGIKLLTLKADKRNTNAQAAVGESNVIVSLNRSAEERIRSALRQADRAERKVDRLAEREQQLMEYIWLLTEMMRTAGLRPPPLPPRAKVDDDDNDQEEGTS
jgi:hypothetical protein